MFQTTSEPTPPIRYDDPIEIPMDASLSLLNQLGNLTSGHLSTMQARLNGPGCRTFFCLGISVLPEYQSRGVGSALLTWVTNFADENRASCWIHLSDSLGGVKALERRRFVEVNRLEVDLDSYAQKSRAGEQSWETYKFRYMRREANVS